MREANATSLVLRTNRGLLTCERTPTGDISVAMGVPLFGWSDIPLAQELDTVALPLAGSPAACSMGNPHCTYFVDDLASVDIATIGPAIETHALFRSRPTFISSRSLIATIYGCGSGNVGRVLR